MVRICRLLVVGGILAMDVFATFLTPNSNTSYEAHLTGALVGLLVGLVVRWITGRDGQRRWLVPVLSFFFSFFLVSTWLV